MLFPIWGVPEALEAGVSPPKSGNCMLGITQNCSPNLTAPALDPSETESPNNGYTIIKRYIYMYTHTQNCIVPPPPPNLYTTSSKAYEHCLSVTWSLLPSNGRPFFFFGKLEYCLHTDSHADSLGEGRQRLKNQMPNTICCLLVISWRKDTINQALFKVTNAGSKKLYIVLLTTDCTEVQDQVFEILYLFPFI